MSDASGSLPGPRQPAHRYRRLLLTSKALVAVVACVVFLLTAAGWSGTRWLDRQLRTVPALDPHSTAITHADAQRGDENILLVGSDSRAGESRSDYVGDATMVPGARSDIVMIAHLPADRSRVVIVSFPRDLQIHRPPCAVWDSVSNAYTGQLDPGAEVAKLNTAYQVGGPQCVTRVVQHLSGLAVTRFVGVDFQGFTAMVDAVGGVPVCLARPLTDTELGSIIPRAGTSTISGPTALNFVRARHVVGDPTGDYGRIIRQQRFLSALLRETLSPAVLLNPGRLRAVAEAVTANTVGANLRTSDLLTLSQSVRGLDLADISFVTVPTTGKANRYGNEELRVVDNVALFQAIIDGTPLPGGPRPEGPVVGPDTPATGPTARTAGSASGVGGPVTKPAGPSPAQVTVRVLNASRIADSAAGAARMLRAAGFRVLQVGDSEELVDNTTIRYSPDRRAEALTLFAALPEAVLQADQRLIGSVVVLVGPDFQDTAATGSAALAPSREPAHLATVNAADTTCG